KKRTMGKVLGMALLLLIAVFTCGSVAGNPALAQEASRKTASEPADEFQEALNNGRLLASQGRPEEAIAELQRAAKLRDQKCVECFRLIGQIHFQLGRMKEAAIAFRQTTDLKPPNEAEMYNVLGVALYLQNEKESYEQAAVALQRAIELSKGRVVKAYYNLAFALIKSGKEREGVAALKKYLDLDPNSSMAGHASAQICNTKMDCAPV